jgi:hypothetical protein
MKNLPVEYSATQPASIRSCELSTLARCVAVLGASNYRRKQALLFEKRSKNFAALHPVPSLIRQGKQRLRL